VWTPGHWLRKHWRPKHWLGQDDDDDDAVSIGGPEPSLYPHWEEREWATGVETFAEATSWDTLDEATEWRV